MSELKDRLHADMTAAMKSRDLTVVSTLRMALAAIGTAEVAGDQARQLEDAEVTAVLQKEVASRKDSAEAYTAAGRSDLAAKELSEVEVLQRYLPAPLTEQELQTIVNEEVQAAAGDQAPSPRLLGTVIKAVNVRAKGRADGAHVAALVKQRLGL